MQNVIIWEKLGEKVKLRNGELGEGRAFIRPWVSRERPNGEPIKTVRTDIKDKMKEQTIAEKLDCIARARGGRF